MDNTDVKDALVQLSKYIKNSQSIKEIRNNIDEELATINDDFLVHFENLAKETDEIGQAMHNLRDRCLV